jgi:hypothetical protein
LSNITRPRGPFLTWDVRWPYQCEGLVLIHAPECDSLFSPSPNGC